MSAGHSNFVSDSSLAIKQLAIWRPGRASVLMLILGVNLLAPIFDDTRIDAPGPRVSREPRESSGCCKGKG